MIRTHFGSLALVMSVVTVTSPAGLRGAQGVRILGYLTQGGKVNTDAGMAVWRPPLRAGSVTAQGGNYDSIGDWAEPAGYSVAAKASGSWNAATKQMKEFLEVTIAKSTYPWAEYNGTWRFESSGACAQDPWRFPVKCTGIQMKIAAPIANFSKLRPAVPYPLTAAGRLEAHDLNLLRMTEVLSPKASEAVANPAQVFVQAQIHNAVTPAKGGQIRFEVRPYGSPDFPTADTQSLYLSKSIAGFVGGQASAFFDLSGLKPTDWQVAASFFTESTGVRSPWVRFSTPKVLTKPASLLNVEGESLVASASAAVIVQPMQQFGPHWSGNAHLFWNGAPGATLTLKLDVPVAAKYAVELYMTRAPDFGDVEIKMSSLLPTMAFSGFAPQVLPSGPLGMGKFQLSAGVHSIQFRVTGKYKDSKGYKIGFDRIRLYPE